MGRGQKRSWGGGGGRGGGRGDNTWKQDNWSKSEFTKRDDMKNAAFEEYYRAQGVIPDGEWPDFLATLRRPLPVTFRINGSGKFADHLRDKLQRDFFAELCKDGVTVDGEPITPPRQLAWYPNGYAWQLEFSRNQLRKLPLLADIHNFVKHANDAGSISRQEAVSMVPPLFLDVQPTHRVLDMCAAPGSKTFQLLEALHSGSRPGQTPPGFVVANDADFMRCNLLTHQTKRVCSPCLLVTNHDASRFPAYLAGAPAAPPPPEAAAAADAPDGAKRPPPRPPRYQVRFDRILADVPCSGDGTLRKSPDIWRKWNISGGNSLHPIQLKIALHGAKMLEVGGRMVYSTCTFNPVEDEAVVAELLLRCGGALELLDVSECMPELRRMAGKHHWKVKDRHRFYDSWEEARDIGYKLEESMFSSPAKAALPLERCMRFLPHHGDTGGFFVAVLRKVSELPDERKQQQRQGQGHGGKQQQQAAEATGDAAAAEDDEEEEENAAEDDAAAAACAAAAAAGAAEEDGEEGGEAEEAGANGDAAGGKDEAGAATAAAPASGDAMEGVERPAGGEGGSGEAGAAAAPAAAAEAPLDVARTAAEAAVASAEAALVAFEAGDWEGAARASANAAASARRAGAAGQRQAGQAAAATAPKPQQDRQQRQQDRQQQQQKRQKREQQQPQQQAVPPQAAGEGEEEAAAGPSAQSIQTSWIRGGGGRGRADGGKYAYIDPVAPLEDDAVLSSLYDYYGIPPDFPLRSQLVMRSLDRQPKRLYFVARSVLDLMMQDSREALKVVSTGLKVFERQILRDQVNECPYRLSQEGLPLVLPYITRQRIEVPPQVLLTLLRERNLILPEAAAVEGDTTASGKPRGTKPTLTDDKVLAALEPLKLGCIVCELAAEDAHRLGFAASTRAGGAEARTLATASATTGTGVAAEAEADGGDGGEEVTGGLAANAPLAVVAWKGKAGVAIMVEKAECAQMIDKLEAELKKLST
ncbi:hypothetical protein PLESTB_000474300 [Pleodorina starrii]|uniref:SAM-dependent MTase RsmB/NOP-type domain-containing protein n=1 Tax=Pleodorina starrii TaxID=330485 RepID=A0A9W6EZW0_9CHLO|nr:hypothetical protein PLESTM_001592400 [Pleodorina starrii]GLC51177.1 hypothetical protein PLESTB_000474300 [Pleodorina starrii]GLC63535.1 hypothetical protein PLESTF_000046800 [Pleodorina starrii]